MRQSNALVAIVAGTVVLAGTAIRFLRRQHLRNKPRRPHPSLSVTTKRARHPDVCAALDSCAPCIRADVWCRQHVHSDTECTFCLETIRPDRKSTLRITPCRHVFHAACLEEWVFYAAEACLDWRQYSISDNGRIEAHVREPTCPNCSKVLPVLPEPLVRQVMLTCIARSLSLIDMATVAEMYDNGLVYREEGDRIVERPRDLTVLGAEGDAEEEDLALRSESTLSEPMQIVVDAGVVQDVRFGVVSRRSLPENREVRLWSGPRGAWRGRRRHSHMIRDDILAPVIALPMLT